VFWFWGFGNGCFGDGFFLLLVGIPFLLFGGGTGDSGLVGAQSLLTAVGPLQFEFFVHFHLLFGEELLIVVARAGHLADLLLFLHQYHGR
jgi:hypothetical protein